jgi:hypothetical protein
MALQSGRYVRDPWAQGVLAPLSRGDSVILIGSGQTTVDLVVALYGRGHEGRIVCRLSARPPAPGVPDIRVQAERLAHLLIGGNLGWSAAYSAPQRASFDCRGNS